MLAHPFRAVGVTVVRLARAIVRSSVAASAESTTSERVVFRHYV